MVKGSGKSYRQEHISNSSGGIFFPGQRQKLSWRWGFPQIGGNGVHEELRTESKSQLGGNNKLGVRQWEKTIEERNNIQHKQTLHIIQMDIKQTEGWPPYIHTHRWTGQSATKYKTDM